MAAWLDSNSSWECTAAAQLVVQRPQQQCCSLHWSSAFRPAQYRIVASASAQPNIDNIGRIGASRRSNSSAAWVEDKLTSVTAPSANGGCGRPCWSLWWCTSAAVPYLPSAAAPTRSPHGRRGAADGERWPAGTLLNLSIGWCPCPRLCRFGPVW